jgi:hypothetical protein
MDLHTAVEIVTALIGFAGFVILLLIRTSQAEVKAELLARITEVSTIVAVHDARDEERFGGIDAKLGHIENQLDRVTGRLEGRKA